MVWLDIKTDVYLTVTYVVRKMHNDKDNLEDLGLDGKIILKFILNTERGLGLDSCGPV
jgi:hypothetical protein